MASTQNTKIIANNGEWKSKITSQFILEGNCKSLNELQVRNVHEYGGGSYVSVTKPQACSFVTKGVSTSWPNHWPTPVQWSSWRICAMPIHSLLVTTSMLSRSAIVRRIRMLSPKTYWSESISAVGMWMLWHKALISTQSPELAGWKSLVWIQWNKPYMPWDETSVHILQISDSGELGKSRKLLEGGSYFGVQWNSSTSELYVVADVTGFWNVYTVDVEKGSLKQNIYPADTDIGGPLWQFADDRPVALKGSTGVVLAVDEDLVYKTGESAKPIESVKEAGFTVFSFLTVSHNKLFSIATGPKRSLSLIEVDLETFEIHPDVQQLDLTRTRSKKIEGLDHLKKINSLCFRWNLLSKIENLSNLVTLTELDLYDNQITKIENLEALVNLETLDLSFNRIAVIEGLDMLSKLTTLYLTHNKIGKIEGLSKLVNLETLELGANQIVKIENLDKNIKLKFLYLGANQIEQMENLGKLTQLEVLSLPCNAIQEIQGIEDLIELKQLILCQNGIKQICGLENNTKLEILDLNTNILERISGIGHLQSLTDFWAKRKSAVQMVRCSRFEKFAESLACLPWDESIFER